MDGPNQIKRGTYGDDMPSQIGILADELAMNHDTLQKIASGRSKTLDEVTADNIACGIGRPDLYEIASASAS
jgi:hypothetical protein